MEWITLGYFWRVQKASCRVVRHPFMGSLKILQGILQGEILKEFWARKASDVNRGKESLKESLEGIIRISKFAQIAEGSLRNPEESLGVWYGTRLREKLSQKRRRRWRRWRRYATDININRSDCNLSPDPGSCTKLGSVFTIPPP